MLVTLANGLQVDAEIGCLVFRLTSQKSVADEGGLPIVAFSEGLLQVQMPDGSLVTVSGDAIESVACPAQPPVEITLTDGSKVIVPASVAPVVNALVAAQQVALNQIRDLLDTTQVGQLQAQLDQATAQLNSTLVLLQKRTDALTAIVATAQTAIA